MEQMSRFAWMTANMQSLKIQNKTKKLAACLFEGILPVFGSNIDARTNGYLIILKH